MLDRQFNEAELRSMLADAVGYREDVEQGRWVIATTWEGAEWEVVVEPDPQLRRLVIITAYMI
jgi:hypothetical protein